MNRSLPRTPSFSLSRGTVACALSVACLFPGAPASVSAQEREIVLENLDQHFLHFLSRPGDFQHRVQEECEKFPEGTLLAHTMTALGLCHRIFEHPDQAAKRLPHAETALQLGLAEMARRIPVPEGDFRNLSTLQNEGACLSQLAMALAGYRLAGGRTPLFVETEKRFADVLEEELDQRQGHPIMSHPNQLRSFDTTRALFALHLHDRIEGTDRSEALIRRHLDWILENGMDPGTLLPGSRILPGGHLAPSRGSDLSWRIVLWHEMDPDLGQLWYEQYRSRFWKNSTAGSGFREWGNESNGRMDLGSGPIIGGIGGNATLFGISTSLAVSDEATSARLMDQALRLHKARHNKDLFSRLMVRSMDGATRSSGIATSGEYLTGYLLGDVTLYYSISWNPYPDRPLE